MTTLLPTVLTYGQTLRSTLRTHKSIVKTVVIYLDSFSGTGLIRLLMSLVKGVPR